MNNENLKTDIQDVIKANGNQEITGPILQQSLIAIINQFGSGSVFGGFAVPSTMPINTDVNMFYMAKTAGTYVNFGGYVLGENKIAIFNNKTGVWVAENFIDVNSIEDIQKTNTVGLVDTYTISMTDGSTYNFEVTNGDTVTYWTPKNYDEKSIVIYNDSIYRIANNQTALPTDVPGVSVKWIEIAAADGLILKNNTKAVNGNEINLLVDDKIKLINYSSTYAQRNQVKNINDAIISIKATDYSGFLVLNTLSMTSASIGISVSMLSSESETASILDNYRVATGSLSGIDVTTIGVVTLRLNPYNNNGFFIEIKINATKLWANYSVFNSRPDTSYLNAGFKKHLVGNVFTPNNIINVDSSSVASDYSRGEFLKRLIKEFRAFDSILLGDFVFISQFFRNSNPAINEYYIFISKKTTATDIATSANPSLIGRVTIPFLSGVHRVNIMDNATQTKVIGDILVDLDVIPLSIPYLDFAQNPTYNTRGIKDSGKIDVFSKRSAPTDNAISFVPYDSVYDAFTSNKDKRIIVGNKELISETLPLTSKLDYKTKENRELPSLTLISTSNWKYNTYTLKLREFHDGYYYLQSDYNIIRTTDLNTPTAGWEVIATTTNLGISVYPFNNIRIVNDELVISAKQGSDFVFFWVDLKTKLPREITVNGVTSNHWITPTNGSMILPFSIDTYGSIYLMALYDVGVTGVSRGSSQKVYGSKDRGKTFTLIFDYDTSNVINWSSANKQKESFHIHGVTYDPYWSRIWFVSGDNNTHLDNTSVFWSDDFGITWNWRRLAEKDSPTGARQIMNLIPFEDHLIGLSDSPDVGVCRINRNSKSAFTIESAVRYLPRELYAWGRNYVWHKGVLYMTFGFQQGATGAGGFLLSTIDGYSFTKSWEDSGAGVISDQSLWIVSDGKKLYMNVNNSSGNTLVFE